MTSSASIRGTAYSRHHKNVHQMVRTTTEILPYLCGHMRLITSEPETRPANTPNLWVSNGLTTSLNSLCLAGISNDRWICYLMSTSQLFFNQCHHGKNRLLSIFGQPSADHTRRVPGNDGALSAATDYTWRKSQQRRGCRATQRGEEDRKRGRSSSRMSSWS